MKIVSSVFVLLWAIAVFAQGFLPATEDVPVMDGLYQVEEEATFDSPSEKMTIISAKSQEKPDKVSNYYRQILMNLGWTVIEKNHYVRGSDTLTLEMTTGKETTIQFKLVQKN